MASFSATAFPAQSTSPVVFHNRGQQPHSCVLCSRRKVRCDRRDPCSNCTKARAECIFRTPAPPRRRKRRSPETTLHARLRRYEQMLEARGVDMESLDAEFRNQTPDESDSKPKNGPESNSPSTVKEENSTTNTGSPCTISAKLSVKKGDTR